MKLKNYFLSLLLISSLFTVKAQDKTTTLQKTIDMSSASAGIYIVEIGNSKTKISKKIIVK
jgi:hypothetical protein